MNVSYIYRLLTLAACGWLGLTVAWADIPELRTEPLVPGPDDGPIVGPLAFHLLADGVQLTPTSFVDPTLPNGGAFQMISRTYDAASLAGNIGQSMSIVLGVEDANTAGNRVIFDDVSLEIVPEPSASLLLGLAGVGLAFFRSRRK